MAVYGPGDIDPSTGQPYPDPETVATHGLTLNGFGAAPAAPMRGAQPKFPYGGGAKPAVPMRGPMPNFPPLGPGPDTGQSPPYTGPPSGNGFATGAGGPTQGSGPPFPVHSGFGGAPAVPMYRGAGENPADYPVTESGAPTPGHLPSYGPWHAGGSPTGPTVADPNQPGGYSIWDLGRTLKGLMGQPSLPGLPAAIGESGSAAPGDTGGYVPSGLNAAPSGQGGIGSDANIPLAGGGTTGGPQFGPPQGSSGMPWAGNNVGRPYGAPVGRVVPGSVNLGRGMPGVHPAVIAHAAAAAAQQAGQQPNSPFTMIMRPNAPANNQGGRGGGGTPLATALDLSGWRPQAAAPAPVPRAVPRSVVRAPVRGPLHPAALGPASTANYPVTGSGSPTPMDIQDQSRGRTFPKYNLTGTPDPGSVEAFGGGVWGGS